MYAKRPFYRLLRKVKIRVQGMFITTRNFNKIAIYGAAVTASVFIFLGANAVVSAAFAGLFSLFAVISGLIKGKYSPYTELASRIFLLVLFGIAAAQTARTVYYTPAQRVLEKYSDEQCELIAEIEKISSYGEGYANYDASLMFVDAASQRTHFGSYPKIRVSAFGMELLEVGDIVMFNAIPKKPQEVTAGGFEERRYLESQGIFITCTAEGGFTYLTSIEPGFAARLRNKMSDGIDRYVGTDGDGYAAAISKCMLLGDKSDIDSYLKDIFRASGISHVLSVSGMHLSILFYAISAILGIGRCKRRRRAAVSEVVSCIIAAAYMVIADFTPSVMRAGFMMIIANAVSLFTYCYRKAVPFFRRGRREIYGTFDSVSCLMGAAAVICLVSPYSVYDIGFQLSFLSCLGIIMTLKLFSERKSRIRPAFLHPVYTCVLVSVSAVAFTMPVCVYNFGQISSVSMPANLLIAPLMTPLLVLLLFLALFSLVPANALSVCICSGLGMICRWISSLCIEIAQFFSGFDFSVLSAKSSFLLNMVFAAFIVVVVFGAFIHHGRICAAGTVSTIVLSFLCFAVFFVNTTVQYFQPQILACTNGGNAYAGIAYADKRIVFDSGENIASRHTQTALLGEQLYRTDNIYVAVVGKNTDFGILRSNIGYFDEYEGIHTLLVPSLDVCRGMSADTREYRDFVMEISARGYPLCFYSESFGIFGLDIECIFDEYASAFRTGDFVLAYSDDYSPCFVQSAAADSGLCLYFCKRVSDTEGSGYSGKARLFVPSALAEEIPGSEKLPTAKPKYVTQQ